MRGRGGARQGSQLGPRCGAGLRQAGVLEEFKTVGGSRRWEMKAERSVKALQVRLGSLDFILGPVGTVEGFLGGDD